MPHVTPLVVPALPYYITRRGNNRQAEHRPGEDRPPAVAISVVEPAGAPRRAGRDQTARPVGLPGRICLPSRKPVFPEKYSLCRFGPAAKWPLYSVFDRVESAFSRGKRSLRPPIHGKQVRRAEWSPAQWRAQLRRPQDDDELGRLRLSLRTGRARRSIAF